MFNNALGYLNQNKQNISQQGVDEQGTYTLSGQFVTSVFEGSLGEDSIAGLRPELARVQKLY